MSRILLITNIFPPFIGGPAIFIDRLATSLAARGHEVTVVCSSEGTPPAGYDADRKFKICRVSLSNRYLYEVKVRLVLAWQLLRHRMILVNGLENYLAPIARFLGRRYILKVVGDSVWEQGRNWGLVTQSFEAFQDSPPPPAMQALARARKRWLDLAQVVITPGAWLGQVVQKWGVAPERLRVIRNGAPLHAFKDVQPAERTGELDIIFVGRLTNWKGVETLLLAMVSLEGVKLTIIGDGPELPMLRGLVDQLNLQQTVTLSGKMDQKLLHKRMAEAHVLALPSGYEGLSHTLLEAGAAGLARLASNIGGNADAMTDKVDGLLLPYGDVAAWRAAFVQLRDDDALRVRLGTAAKQASAKDDFIHSVSAYVSLLEEYKQ